MTTANMLDLTALPAAKRREVLDFFQFLLSRRDITKKTTSATTEYHFSDLCGTLSWKGDAVAAQRSLRDEW